MSTWNRFAGVGNHRRGGRFKTGDKKAAPTKGCRTGISPAANILPLAVVCAVGRRSAGQIRSRLRARSSAALTPRRGVIHSRSPFAASRKTHSAAQESTKYMESNAALGEIPRTGPQREKKLGIRRTGICPVGAIYRVLPSVSKLPPSWTRYANP